MRSVPTEREENSAESLEFFSQDVEQEMTTALESAVEEEADSIDFVDLCEELESLERRVVVQSMHIQQAKLEAYGGLHQHEEQLEEVGMRPAEGLVGVNLSGEVVAEQKPSDKDPTGVKAAIECQAKSTKEEDVVGSQCDLPIDKEEVQLVSLQ